jgi:bacillithiol system protein YtxJ
MNWNHLNKPEILEEIKEVSKTQKVMIFKHSTRCSISAMALNRLERSWQENEMQAIKPYYLDLLNFRAISNQIEMQFGVEHQSPQLIIIENAQAVYDASHYDINYQDLLKMVKR